MGSMKSLRSRINIILFSVLLSAPVAVYSATITSVSNTIVTEPFCLGICGAFGGSITTTSPNNDEVGGANGNSVIQSYGAVPGLRILADYLVVNSGGTTEYLFTHQISNIFDVSLGLFGHKVTLETGVSNPGSGLDFDFPDIDPAPFVSTTTQLPPGIVTEHTATNISWDFSTGKFGNRTVGFALDLPDCGGASSIVCDAGIDSYTVSILHEFSPVPIPAAAWLFASGLFGLIGASVRKANR